MLFNKGGGCVFCHIEEKRAGGGAELNPLPVYKDTSIKKRGWNMRGSIMNDIGCSTAQSVIRQRRRAKTSDVLMPACNPVNAVTIRPPVSAAIAPSATVITTARSSTTCTRR